jgi:hypothetical protein
LQGEILGAGQSKGKKNAETAQSLVENGINGVSTYTKFKELQNTAVGGAVVAGEEMFADAKTLSGQEVKGVLVGGVEMTHPLEITKKGPATLSPTSSSMRFETNPCSTFNILT